MVNTQKLRLLEDVFEVSEGELDGDMDLDSLENWDSLTKLSLIVMVEEEYGKVLSSDIIKSFRTVNDIIEEMM